MGQRLVKGLGPIAGAVGAVVPYVGAALAAVEVAKILGGYIFGTPNVMNPRFLHSTEYAEAKKNKHHVKQQAYPIYQAGQKWAHDTGERWFARADSDLAQKWAHGG